MPADKAAAQEHAGQPQKKKPAVDIRSFFSKPAVVAAAVAATPVKLVDIRSFFSKP